MNTRNLLAVVTLFASMHEAAAMDALWQGWLGFGTNDAVHSWTNTANWSGGVVPNAPGDSASFTGLTLNLTVYLHAPVTVGSITNFSNFWEINLQPGTAGSINFDTGSVDVPRIDMPNRGTGVGLILYAPVRGSQGLVLAGSSGLTAIRVNGATDWTAFTGSLALARGLLSPQAAATGNNFVLPGDERLDMGALGTANLELQSGRPVTLASLAGTTNSFVYSSSGAATLTLGDGSTDADFAGMLGDKSDGLQHTNTLNITKNNAGTQRLSGNSIHTGVTTINAGTLLVNGTHNQGAGINAGRYLVQAGGALGGNGKIVLSDVSAGTTGLSISGALSPGDPAVAGGVGTLTVDAGNSARAAIAFETGGALNFDLAAADADTLVLTNAAANDIFFNNNTINFNDTTTGGVANGSLVLVHSDAAGAYNGLTVDGSGNITAGLVVGTGLGAYPGSALKLVGNDIVLNISSTNLPQPVAIGMNYMAAGATGMRTNDLAGIPGTSRFANWNNFAGPGGGQAVTNTLMVDSRGAAVTGLVATYAAAAGGGMYTWVSETGLTNDLRLYNGVYDQYSGVSTVTVAGIPYATYDARFFFRDDGANRAAAFSVGGVTYFARGGAGQPDGGGANYVISGDTTEGAGTDIQQGNCVVFTGLTSSTLSAALWPVYAGDAVTRLKFAGLQLVSTAIQPTQPPGTVTGVSAVASVGQVTVTWSPVGGATSYHLLRSASLGGPYVTNGTVSAFSTSLVDLQVTNGVTYYYEVAAVNGVGQGTPSAPVSATPVDPSSLTVLSVKFRAYNSFGMAVWDRAGVPRVGYWNDLVGPVLEGDTVGLTNPVSHLGVAFPGVAVTFRAGSTGTGSYDANGTIVAGTESTNEANLTATVFDQYNGVASTVTVSGLTFTNYDVLVHVRDDGSTRGGSLSLGGTTYYLRGGAGNPTTEGAGYVQSLATTLVSATSANYVRFSGVTGSSFRLAFVAQNLGDGTQRLKVEGIQVVSSDAVVAPSAPPGAPSSFTASGGNREVALNWSVTASATNYLIKRSTTSGSGHVALANVPAPLTSYADVTAGNGTSYYYVVAAQNSAGTGTNSTEAAATPSLPAFTPATETVYQYSVHVRPIFNATNLVDEERRAYLWVPPACTNLRGVVLGIHNMLERPMFDDPVIRQGCADADLGIVFIASGEHRYPLAPAVGPPNMALGMDPNQYTNVDINPMTGLPFASASEQCGAEVATILTNLAVESGYNELKYAPILLTGHSAASTFIWVRSVHVSAALSNRVFAILPLKGTFPGSMPGGMPVFHVSSEWQEISDWGNTWERSDAPNARKLRGQAVDKLFSEYVQPGTGHYHYDDAQSGPLALFIKKAAQARIPADWAPTGFPALVAVNATNGYLVDVTTLGSGGAAPVSYAAWIGAGKDPRRAYWYFDQELAQAVCDAMNAGFAKKPQLISAYQTPTQQAPLGSQANGVGYVYQNSPLDWQPDGVTFRVRNFSLNQSPTWRQFHGGGVGIPGGPVLVKGNGSGAVRQMGPDTFRIWMSRCGNPLRMGQPWEPFIIAYHPGDGEYRRADRPLNVTTAARVINNSGPTQVVAFAAIPDQPASARSPVQLSATASSGYPVQFWVVSGPFHCDPYDSSILVPDDIPPQTKFPMRVVVGAWQWGLPSGVMQSSPAAYQEFFITAGPVDAWRRAKLGTYNNSGPAADTADAEADGYANLLEYATGGDPAVADQQARMAGSLTGGVFGLRFTRDTNSVDATLIVEAANSVTNGAAWTGINTNQGGLWSDSGRVVETGPGAVVEVRVADPAAPAPERHLRVKVTRP